MDEVPDKLIRCGDHSLAPWAVACVHVMEGTAADLVRVPQDEGSEVKYDWACRECYEKLQRDECPVEDLRAVCVHCLRACLRELHGIDSDEEPED